MAIICLYSSSALSETRYSTLEFGSRGAEVLALQKALITVGFNPNGTDGKFGRGTENAVIAYQKSKNLVADGKAGTQTLTMLYADVAAQNASNDANSSVPSTVSADTLKYGDSGSRVTALQEALVKLGYNTNGVDGRFGAGTQRAVIAFQKANKLTADGLAGRRTLELINQQVENAGGSSSSSSSGSSGSASSSSTGFTRTLRKGYTGDDVRQVQQQLKSLGYYSGSVDGVYGTGSMAAVQAFQRKNGLTADGLAGAQTFAKLFSSSATGADSDASSNSSNSSSSSSSSASGSNTYVTLRVGSTGEDVRRLQRALAELNYSVTVDGTYGNATRDAVIAFQQRNSLTADGVAGALTQTKLYSGSANAAGSSSGGSSSGGSSSTPSPTIDANAGAASGPSKSEVKLLHWFNAVKPSIRAGQNITIFDPASSLQWTLRLFSLGRHADSEPKTLADTQIMFKAFGNTNTWTPKPVYVQLPSGTWTLASMHNVPHLTGSISDNGFDGHLCVHFLRDMDECRQNDPNYGVTNQEVIRKKWKELTGETID